MELFGHQRELNLGLENLKNETAELVLECYDSMPIEICKALEGRQVNIERLTLRHVNITPGAITPKSGGGKPTRKISSHFFQHQRFQNGHNGADAEEEFLREKEAKELELFKRIFKSFVNLTHLNILDGAGVLTEPLHYIQAFRVTCPLLESLKLGKTLRKNHSTNDDLLIITNEGMSSLADLDHLKVLHLVGFAGRKCRQSQYHFVKVDDAVNKLARKGLLEEFVFTQSGMTYHSLIGLIKFCLKLRTLTISSRFSKPGLFMLHNNISFLRLGEHHMETAVYDPEPGAERQLTMTLTNVEQEQCRYEPSWVCETFPEERIEDIGEEIIPGVDHGNYREPISAIA